MSVKKSKTEQNGALQRGVRIYMGVWPKAEYSYGGGRRAALTRLCLPPRDQIHIFVQTYEGHLTNIFRRWQFIVTNLLSHTFATQIIWQIPQERCDKANYFICFTNIHMKRGAILCRPIHCTGLAFKRFVFFANKTSSHLIKLHGYYPSQSFVGWVTNRATSAPHMVGDNPVVRGHTGVGVN